MRAHINKRRTHAITATSPPVMRRALTWLATGLALGAIVSGSGTARQWMKPGVTAIRLVASVGPMADPAIPHPGTLSVLFGVACASASSCWAVGGFRNAKDVEFNEAFHWGGSRWSAAPVPSPGGSAGGDVSELEAVTCPSATSCWAVGFTQKFNLAVLNQALRWNGKKWSKTPVPSPAGSAPPDSSVLNGVTCNSSTSCWAVGSAAAINGSERNVALHWNGRKWSRVTTPDPAGTAGGDLNLLSAVSCLSAADCWAVGATGTNMGHHELLRNEALHWNGRRWSLIPTPNPGGTAPDDINSLLGVACPSTTSCWAVGSFGSLTQLSRNEALHWNGHKWSLAFTPDPDGTGAGAQNRLRAVACTSRADCWAVGNYGSTPGVVVNEALRWNGKKWTLVPTPDQGG